MPTEDLAAFLRGPEGKTLDALWDVFDGEPFEPRTALTAPERHRLTYRRLRHVNKAIGSGAALLDDRAGMCDLFAAAAIVDPAVFHAMILHYPLCLGFVVDLGADDPATRACRNRLEAMDGIGVLLLTEAGRGGSHLATQTEAVYDHDERRFTLHTPTPAAAKFPTACAEPGMPKTAVVFAKVVVEGQDRGVFGFHLEIRGATGIPEGVRIAPMTETTGLPHDYAAVTFDNVSVPYGHWLRGDADIDTEGRFTDPAGSHSARLRRSLAMSRPVWRAVVAAAAAVSRAATTIALRHSYARTTASRLAPDRPVIGFRNQQLALFAALADSYALTIVANRLKAPDERPPETSADTDTAWTPWSSVDLELPLLKAMAVTTAAHTVDTCRARCGALASVATDTFTAYRGFLDAYVSAGGDNQLIHFDTARAMAEGAYPAPPDTPIGDITRPDGWLAAAAACENRLRAELATAITAARDQGEDELTVWNDRLALAERAALAYADRVVLEAFAAAVGEAEGTDVGDHLARLAAFHAFTWMERRGRELLRTGVLDPAGLAAVDQARNRLCDELLDVAPELVAAFGIPEERLGAVLGTGDYLEALLGTAGARGTG